MCSIFLCSIRLRERRQMPWQETHKVHVVQMQDCP